ATECINVGGALGHTRVAQALHVLALVMWRRKRYDEAQRLCLESFALYRSNEDSLGMADVLNHLGVLAINRLDYATARDYYTQSLALHRKLGNKLGIAVLLQNLGDAASTEGD